MTVPPLFSLPEYETAGLKFFSAAMIALMRSKDPLFNMISANAVEELPATRVNVGDQVVDAQPFDVQSMFRMNHGDILAGSFDSLYKALDEAAQGSLASVMPQMFQHLSQVTDATGHTINAEGQPLTVDLFLEMIDQTEWSFNEDGSHNMSIATSPQGVSRLQSLEWTEEQTQRMNDIISRKREVFFARRRSRRLPGHTG